MNPRSVCCSNFLSNDRHVSIRFVNQRELVRFYHRNDGSIENGGLNWMGYDASA